MRRVWIATAIYAAVFTGLAAYRWHVWSYGSDTGTFAQAVLDAGGGFRNGPEGGSHYRFHFSPVLALLWPLLSLWRSPLALQVAQVGLTSLCAPLLYALLRPYVDERVAFRATLLALAYPPLAAISFGEFHEVAFFPPLALTLLLAADRGWWLAFAAAGAGALATREDICIELAAIGLGFGVLALVQVVSRGRAPSGGDGGEALGGVRRPAAGVAFAALGLAAAVVAGFYDRAVYAAFGGWPHGHFYDYPFASGPPAVLAALLLHPAVVVPAIATLGRFTYLLEAFAPLVLLPLRSRWTLLALPALAVVLLASEQSVWRMGNHYASMWAPWLLAGAGAALCAIERRQGAAAATAWAHAALVACAVFLIAFDPMHLGHYLTPPYRDLASARAALACVPEDASVSTHDEWFAEIAARYPHATIQATEGVTFLVYADDFPNHDFQRNLRPAVAAGVSAGRYALACSFGAVRTYRQREVWRASAGAGEPRCRCFR